MPIAIKSKLVAKDLGNPKAVTALPDGQDELVLGTIIGQANGISERTDQRTGDLYQGIKGFFEGVPADPKKDTVQSGICYLPGGFQEMVIAQLVQEEPDPEKEGKTRKVNPIVSFAFELATIKATNAAGYSYKLTPLMNLEKGDPLEALRQRVSEVKALPKPDHEEKKAGGKKR